MDAPAASPGHSRVVDWMQRRFVAVAPTETVEGARELMRLGRMRHLLVVEDGAVVGLLSYRDLLEAQLQPELAGDVVGKPRSGTGEEPVGAHMVPAPVSVGPGATLHEAAACMLRLHLGCLPVVERASGPPRLVGIVTESDLLRAAYAGRPRGG